MIPRRVKIVGIKKNAAEKIKLLIQIEDIIISIIYNMTYRYYRKLPSR